MKTRQMVSRFLIAMFFFWLSLGPPLAGADARTARQAGAQPPAIPAGVAPQSDNSIDGMDAILEQIEADEYNITWVEHTYLPDLASAYQAPNRANGFRTYFTPSGPVIIPRELDDDAPLPWRWSSSLSGWGFGAAGQLAGVQAELSLPPAPEPLVVQQNRAEMPRRIIGSNGGDISAGFTEWYLNDDHGLQLGFDILAAPQEAPTTSLQIALAVSTNLQPEQISADSGVIFRSVGGASGLSLGLPQAAGADGVPLPAALAWDGAQVLVQVDVTQAQYPLQVFITITSIGSSPAWEAVGLPYASYQDVRVASAGDVNGDGYSDIIIGAPYYDSGTKPNQGAVWIYKGGASLAVLTQIFYKLGDQEESSFGYSVSTAGDVNGDGYADVVIGAPNWDGADAQQNEGKIQIFHGSASGIDTTPDRTIEGGQANAIFGVSVAFAGNVNGDAYADVIVGAPGYNNTLYGQGRIYVYHGSASGIGATANWEGSTTGVRALMGWSVASAGDVNGDGYADVIVGAPDYSAEWEREGRVFVWHGSSSGVNNNVDGTPANAAWVYGPDLSYTNYQWGWSVSSAGDVNGDGYSDVYLGTPYVTLADDEWLGQSILYLGSATGLLADYETFERGDVQNNQFGYSVACAGDVNGDGYADIIAGEPGWDGIFSNMGRAYVWYGRSSGVSSSNDWSISAAYLNASFGTTVATAGDVNGDGYSDIIVASGGKDGSLVEVQLYTGGPDDTQENASWSKASNLEGIQFGFSVASAGDVNGDGLSDVIVGAPYYDNGQIDEGGVFIYQGTETGPQPSGYYWKKESDLAGAHFGFSVASAGDVDRDGYDDVIVGAPDWEPGGGAWVYRGSSAGMISAPYWHKTSTQADALFGYSVAGAGDTNGDGFAEVIIGAPMMENDVDDLDEGMVYVYRGSSAGIDSTPYFSKDADKAGTHFGRSVASAGDVNRDGYADIIVGAPDYTSNYTAEGGAFVYTGQADKIVTVPIWYHIGDQENAHFGHAVASAGDVNNDGYSDVIVGAPDYDDGQNGEGGVWVFNGYSGGVQSVSYWHREAGQADAFYGFSVSSAGDVNGDGYADVVVGARSMTDSVTDEGTARVFLGSASGLGNVAWSGAGGESLSDYGYSVAAAGDVNGDGYDDIIVGARLFGNSVDTPPANQGKIWVYHGGGGVGETMRLQQLNADDTPIAHNGMTSMPIFFGLHMQGKSPFGRGSMALNTEVNYLSGLLDGSGFLVMGGYSIPSYGGDKFAWYFVNAGTVYHWRARLRYNPASQPYLPATRWLSLPYHSWNEADLRTMYRYTYLPLMIRD